MTEYSYWDIMERFANGKDSFATTKDLIVEKSRRGPIVVLGYRGVGIFSLEQERDIVYSINSITRKTSVVPMSTLSTFPTNVEDATQVLTTLITTYIWGKEWSSVVARYVCRILEKYPVLGGDIVSKFLSPYAISREELTSIALREIIFTYGDLISHVPPGNFPSYTSIDAFTRTVRRNYFSHATPEEVEEELRYLYSLPSNKWEIVRNGLSVTTNPTWALVAMKSGGRGERSKEVASTLDPCLKRVYASRLYVEGGIYPFLSEYMTQRGVDMELAKGVAVEAPDISLYDLIGILES